ncbi:hypothetical protein V6N13_103700 [Hibiscus sabdariffa]
MSTCQDSQRLSNFSLVLNDGDMIQFNTTCDCSSTFKVVLPTQLDSRTSKADFTASITAKSELTTCTGPENNAIMWPYFECSVPPQPAPSNLKIPATWKVTYSVDMALEFSRNDCCVKRQWLGFNHQRE